MNSKNILNKEKRIIFILGSILLLSACGASDEPQPYEENGISAEEPEEETLSKEETEPAQESEAIDKDAEEWKDYFHVSADKLQGNILGYSLLRFSPNPESNMEYKQDRAYLLDEDMVGKGIYISDYMCETEVFLGNILKDVVISHGAVSGENRQYFTDYALQQLADTNWESLDKEWEPDLYIYDRYYEMNPVSGGGGYRFYYYFFPNQEEIRKEETAGEETSMVDIVLYVDADGKISEIKTDTSVAPADDGRIEKWILQTGLFDEDSYGEQIIRNGSPCHEDMVWDFETYFGRFMYPDEVYEQENEGLLASGYVCASAESVADIFLHVMGNRGADVEKYEEWFEYNFLDFACADWESLGEDWIVNEEYDCFFIDHISIGWAGFQIYYYPDFQSMGVDTAKAVVIDCNVGISDGLIGYIDIDFFPITEEEYQAVKQKQTESRLLLVEKGNVLSGTTEITIPMLDRKVEYMPICEFDPDSVAVEHSSRKVKEEIWGFTDAAEIADDIGQKFLKDFDEDNADKGEIYGLLKDKDERYSVPYSTYRYIEDGWKADSQYDCYYVKSNEAEGCMHLQYYFYPEQVSREQTGKTLVFDVYLSEAGIEDIEVSQFWVDYAIMKGYCSMEDLGEMNYYLFCHTDLHKGATGLEAKPSIISNDTQTIEEAKELYQKFKEQLPLEDDSDEDERTEVLYISPDCKWVTTEKWSEFQLVNTVTLFFQKEKVKEKTGRNTEGLAEILIIKDEDTYKEADEQYYKRLSELKKEMRSEGYFVLMKRNLEGDLIAGIKDNFSLLTIRRIEDGAELWSFDLQGMQEKVKKIRDDIREEDMSMVFVEHFRGSEQEGRLVIQVGPSSFFRIDYPSGEVTYLGEYLYSPSFSPDGKYMAYSSIDGDNAIGMDPAEYEQTPSPGIYVKELETGKTAYIYWYPSRETGEDYMESRGFQWIEKEAFEEFMGGRANVQIE